MRSFPGAYRSTPAGGGPTLQGGSMTDVSAPQPLGTPITKKITPGAAVSPLGSALYLPPVHAMMDRTLKPGEYGAPGNPSG